MRFVLILIAFGALIRAAQLFYLSYKVKGNKKFKFFDVYGDIPDSEKSRAKLIIEGLLILFCSLWGLYHLL